MTPAARAVQRTYLVLTLLTTLVGSTGGVVAQPALGRVADVYGYGASYVIAGGALALALPFILLARRERAPSDPITDEAAEPVERSAA